MTTNQTTKLSWVIGLPSGVELLLKDSKTSVEFDNLAQEWHIALVIGHGTISIDEARFYQPDVKYEDMRRAHDIVLNVSQITYIRKIVI